MQVRRLLFVAGAFAAIGTGVAWASALPMPDPAMSIQWGSRTWTVNPADTTAPGVQLVEPVPGSKSTWHMVGSWTAKPDGVNPSWRCDWDLQVDADPFVFGTFSFTNLTAIDQNYSLNVILPTAWPGPLQISGGITGTLLDSNLSGNATLKNSTLGGPIYTALIDGVAQQTLLNAYSFSTASPFPVNWGPPAPANFGPQAALAPSVTTDIEIDHAFNLSAGDGATLQSIFIAVPEPASLALLALGALVAVRRAR
jgi:hypothetical protein